MGGINLGYGKSKEKGKSITAPFFTSTPYSSISGRHLVLDPSIRALQDQAIGRFGELSGNLGTGIDEFLARTGELRGQLSGMQGTLRQARIRPVVEMGNRYLRGLGRRELAGSSFFGQAVEDVSRQIGEASALADADTISAISGLDKDMVNAIIGKVTLQAQLAGESLEVARMRLQQELASFGLGGVTKSSGTASQVGLGLNIGLPSSGGGSSGVG